MWKCCSDLLNLYLQHLIEDQLILRSHHEVIHLGTYVFQELVSGMNLLAKFIIYPQLISDNIPELGLIFVEILPITTLLVVVKRETGLVPPRVEALIRMKTIVRVTNKVSILTDHRAIDTYVACFSALFTGHSSIDHSEMIKAQVLKLLHKKINLGGEHVHAGAERSTLIIPAQIRGHLLNYFVSFLNTESKQWISSSSINMLTGCANQPMMEALDDEPLLHVVMEACRDIILPALPCLNNGIIRDLFKGRDLVPKGIGLAQWKKLGEKCIEVFLPSWHCLLVGIEPLFCLY
jgi:hypothetical protein